METTESAGSGDDEPGSSKLGSQALPTAAAPTQREKEEHFVSHYPFRSWCEHCIRGKAKAMRHVKVDHSDETVPVISADYCFMNSVDDTVITEEVQKKHAPVLIVKGSLGGETSVLRTFRMSGKELVKERVSQGKS